MIYLVIECKTSYVVLLDEEGRFLKAANMNYEVGQRIKNPVLMIEPKESDSVEVSQIETKKRSRSKRTTIIRRVSALAACLVILLGVGFYQNFIVTFASVHMSINPKVQMDINKMGKVVRLNGENPDGESLLEGYKGFGKNKAEVLNELIDRAIDMKFLTEGGEIVISVDAPDDVIIKEYSQQFKSEAQKHLEGLIEATVKTTLEDDSDIYEDDFYDDDVTNSEKKGDIEAHNDSIYSEAVSGNGIYDEYDESDNDDSEEASDDDDDSDSDDSDKTDSDDENSSDDEPTYDDDTDEEDSDDDDDDSDLGDESFDIDDEDDRED